ncbi:MAG: hypothetical protein AMXMBFR82_00730 [Candidatus Hydrogenedentota bacterium]
MEKVIAEASPRFLIVEDEQAQRNLLREVLRREGYECECASTCAEGRDLFSKGKYACALIDLGLPDGNGLTLLSDFSSEDPCTVLMVLTGDTSAETIIDTMRGGAFDYLRKPVDLITLRAAVSRAMAHHAMAMERAELFRLLLEEREQLRARVEAATADIRQYASACEVSNSRLRALLRLAQMSTEYYTDEHLFRQVFAELASHLPLRGLALCNATRRKLLMAVQPEGALEVEFLGSESMSLSGYDSVLAEADPGLLVRESTVHIGGIDVDALDFLVYPQVSRSGTTSTVAFMLVKGREPDVSDSEFLDTCAYFLAFEWERGQLLYHVAHHASLGNIGIELARNFIQPLTAIQTAVEFVSETIDNKEAEQGLAIVAENADRLRRQTQEFRKLSTLRENAVETVTLADYVEQALDMLTVAIQNRGVTIKREFQSECECVLLNGTTLARTILDVILGSLRSVEMGGTITLRLQESDNQHVAFEVAYKATGSAAASSQARDELSGSAAVNPVLQLAERTVHACGGSLSVEVADQVRTTVRIQLPRNATNPSRRWEPVL